jgi:SAM-dependent methyltransferase
VTVDARAAAAWGTDASAYERARPGWPPAALDWLWDRLRLGAGARVLDLAAGTGKLTRALEARAGDVVAVEPLAGMRAQLERAAPGAQILAGTAQALPVPDASVDAIFVAEAFHWFATREVLTEMRRVLRPGGGLGLLWNLEQWDDLPWAADVERALPGAHGTGRHHPTRRATWDVLDAYAGFRAAADRRFAHTHALTADGFIELVGTWSRVANLPAAERDEVLDRVRANVPREGVRLRYETLAVAVSAV